MMNIPGMPGAPQGGGGNFWDQMMRRQQQQAAGAAGRAPGMIGGAMGAVRNMAGGGPGGGIAGAFGRAAQPGIWAAQGQPMRPNVGAAQGGASFGSAGGSPMAMGQNRMSPAGFQSAGGAPGMMGGGGRMGPAGSGMMQRAQIPQALSGLSGLSGMLSDEESKQKIEHLENLNKRYQAIGGGALTDREMEMLDRQQMRAPENRGAPMSPEQQNIMRRQMDRMREMVGEKYLSPDEARAQDIRKVGGFQNPY